MTQLFHTSFSQKAQYYKNKYSSNWIPENNTIRIDIENFNIDFFRESIFFLLNRHNALKTRYINRDNTIFQELYPYSFEEIPIEYFDIISNSIEDDLRKVFILEINKNINIEKGPLFNIAICNISEFKKVIFITVDMSVIEGTSNLILINEFTYIYNYYSGNIPKLNLPEIVNQYTDFGEEEFFYMQNTASQKSKKFWQKYFSDAPRYFFLPTDYPFDYQKMNGDSYEEALNIEMKTHCIEEALSVRKYISGVRSSFKFLPGAIFRTKFIDAEAILIKKTASKIGVSVNSFFLATIYILFYKLSNSADITIGNCVSLRNKEKYSNTLGFFTNIIFTRLKIVDTDSFENLVFKVSKEFLKCFMHKEYPWEKVLEDNSIPYAQVSNCFYDYLNLNDRKYVDNNEEYFLEGAPCIFELNCMLTEYENLVTFNWIFSTEMFKAKTFEKIINYHRSIVVSVLKDPFIEIGSIENYLD